LVGVKRSGLSPRISRRPSAVCKAAPILAKFAWRGESL
ncbi:oxidoreductase, zinc-binding dehydrogenase family, partial [Klebsiella pneumoniae subsp. pneumoniae Ecl8]